MPIGTCIPSLHSQSSAALKRFPPGILICKLKNDNPGMKRWIWPIGIYALTAIALTWPLVLHITERIPLGSERSPTVPLFNLWTLGWNVNRIQLGYQGYWDAPIFYPVQGAFAFSEPQPLTGLLALPFWIVSPALAYNAVLLLFLFLNGLAVYVFLQRRGFAFRSALLGGLLALSLPFLTQERGVLHLLPVFGVILAIDGLWSMTDAPSWQAGLKVGLGVAITFLVSEQFALFLGILMIVAIPFLLPQVITKQFWLSAGLAVVVATALILPVAIPQKKALDIMAFTRGVETITAGSAHLDDYLRPASSTWQGRWFPLKLDGNQRLFPGVLLFLLALAGTIIGLRQNRHRKWTLFLVTSALLAFFISLGLNLEIGHWQPYEILREFVPSFINLRSPFRIGYFVQIYLLLLAILVLEWHGKGQRRIITLILFGLLLLEIIPRPARLTQVPPAIKSDGLVGPTIFLPFPDGRATSAYADTASWMVASLPKSIPLLNGYSGYFPSLHSQLKMLLADFPTPGGMAALRSLGVSTIIIHPDWMDEAQASRLAQYVRHGEILEGEPIGDFLVYRLVNAQLQPVSAYEGGWALETTLEKQVIKLRAYAAVPDEQMYVMAPKVAPLEWRVQLTGPDGETSISDAYLPNAFLLYHGSDRWARLDVPLPPGAQGHYIVKIINVSGEVVAGQEMDIPDG